MKITCIADLHGFKPKLPGGDLLIVAGDLTARDDEVEHADCCVWLEKQDYRKIILVAGNHDNCIQEEVYCYKSPERKITYLQDSVCEIDDTEVGALKIWGSPWTKKFKGINPKCCSFTLDTEFQMKEKFKLIPDDVDILITHSPPYACFDVNDRGKSCGSKSLSTRVNEIQEELLLHVFGHIHEGGGNMIESELGCTFVNASYVDERYRPWNKIIEVKL